MTTAVLGILAFLLWDRSRPEDALLLETLTAGLATVWANLGVPSLFAATGLGESTRPPAPAPGSGPAHPGRAALCG